MKKDKYNEKLTEIIEFHTKALNERINNHIKLNIIQVNEQAIRTEFSSILMDFFELLNDLKIENNGKDKISWKDYFPN